jgi:hypothetical protein
MKEIGLHEGAAFPRSSGGGGGVIARSTVAPGVGYSRGKKAEEK